MTPDVGSRIPPQTLRYLAHPSLVPLWTQVRRRLERNRLNAEGVVTVELDDDGVQRLRGLLGAGTKSDGGRIRLEVLDAALRGSAAACGLATVVAELTGPLIDRGAVRDADREQWQTVWARLDTALAEAGIANAAWVPDFVSGLRRSGLLTRAGSAVAERSVDQAGLVLSMLYQDGMLDRDATVAEPRWELAALASRYTGDAHGLDDGRLVSALVLRAAAAARGMPIAERPAQRRDVWTRLGVTPDLVSGTVLAWSLRPPGSDPWSVMMRARADLRLVTHLTVQELTACGDVLLASRTAPCPPARIRRYCKPPHERAPRCPCCVWPATRRARDGLWCGGCWPQARRCAITATSTGRASESRAGCTKPAYDRGGWTPTRI